MQFLTKLLRRGAVEPDTISTAEHVWIVAEKVGEARKDLQRENEGLRAQNETHINLGRTREKHICRLIMERDAARAEAEANKADAEELARWRQYGQMRDPKTGRLIPKAVTTVDGVTWKPAA